MSLQNHKHSNRSLSVRRTGGVYIALGSNIAFEDGAGARLERSELFKTVLLALRQAGIVTIASSGLWTSPAWPDPTLPEFANAVVEVDPQNRDAQALMLLLLQIEERFGRIRHQANGPRTLDLDLIDYRQTVVFIEGDRGVICPHPRMHERAFVLGPMRQIAPNWRHPVINEDIDSLFEKALLAWPAQIAGGFEVALG